MGTDPLSNSHQARRRREALTKVGCRCHWRDRKGTEEGSGTIVGVTTRGSWPMYEVEWDDNCPPWWGTEVSASHSSLFVIEDMADGN